MRGFFRLAARANGLASIFLAMLSGLNRSEERRVGKECRSLCDWSSDVCSSDLVVGALRDREDARLFPFGRARERIGLDFLGNALGAEQIGRASCRERV